jgi:hypothetical protein
MRPRLIATGLLLSVVLAATASAADVSFVRVWPGWRGTDFFRRISEYFGRPEDPSPRILLRTRPGERSGCYFIVRVRNTGAPAAGAMFRLLIIAPDSPDPRIFTFKTRIPSGQPVFEVGLTGQDWPSQKIHPVAWRLELVSAGGETLAAAQSFLWSM